MISCPDQPGIVAAVSTTLFNGGANIIHSAQHSTHGAEPYFFLRIEFECGQTQFADIQAQFVPIIKRFQLELRLESSARRKRMAIFASKEDHCLQELLWNIRAGDIPADAALVISNHPDLRSLVEQFGVPFHHIPLTPDTKTEAEARQKELCAEVDFLVLARYMQILSPEFTAQFANRVINIHHSFLPAFVGAKPYHQAYARGVKLIGATAHYVTSDLDAGPIIEQDVQRVTHEHDVAELRRLGRQVERTVLARAVKWHAEDRVLVHANRTVVLG